MNWSTALELILPALKLFALVASLAGLALGLGLILRGAATLRWVATLNRWVSSRRATKPLDVTRATPSGNRFLLGAALAAIGVYAMAVLALSPVDAKLAAMLGYDPRYSLAALGFAFLRWLFVAGSALAAAVGLLMLFAPRALAALEARSSYWISSRRLTAGADKMYMPLDRMAERFPRAAGATIAALSAAALAASLFLLLSRS
jgi:hypothetical protein